MSAVALSRDGAGLRKLPTRRTCDGCDVCCTTASVTEIAKPANERCRHLTALAPVGRNCMVYAKRPGSCASFACLWRASDGALSDDFFPADCGFCLWINNPFQWPMVITVGVDPGRPDAWDRPAYRARFKQLAWDLNCVVAIGPGDLATVVFTPNGKSYTKAERPEFFAKHGSVGAMAKDFRPGVKLTLAEIGIAILGYART